MTKITMTTIRSLLGGATLAAVALTLAAPAWAGTRINGLTGNGLTQNALGQNALNPNGLTGNSSLQGYLSGFTVEAIELPDGTVLGR